MIARLVELIALGVLSALLSFTALVFFEYLIATAIFAALTCTIAFVVFVVRAFFSSRSGCGLPTEPAAICRPPLERDELIQLSLLAAFSAFLCAITFLPGQSDRNGSLRGTDVRGEYDCDGAAAASVASQGRVSAQTLKGLPRFRRLPETCYS
jgi:hypothetical protein